MLENIRLIWTSDVANTLKNGQFDGQIVGMVVGGFKDFAAALMGCSCRLRGRVRKAIERKPIQCET